MTDTNTSEAIELDRRTLLQGAALAATAAAMGTLPLSTLAGTPTPATSQPNKLKAMAVNFQPVLNDNQACAAKMQATIERAARDGCNFIVFPEMALQGFERCQDCKQRGSACDRNTYIAGPEFPRMARILGRTDDPLGMVSAEIDLGQYDRFVERSQLRQKRSANGLNAHISRIVAREYANYIGMTLT